MNTNTHLIETGKAQKTSALAVMANRLQVDPTKLHETLKNTVFKGANDHELLALAVVANAYNLNPLTKEIYAFPSKGGIAPIVSIDGWIRITNDHPQFDGIEFEYQDDQAGKPVSCTASIYRKDRSRPVKVTEYFSECSRATEPWKQFPRRMLRHKALKECSRVAFGFSGITDEDEARDMERNLSASKPIFAKPAAVQAGPVIEAIHPISSHELPKTSSPAEASSAVESLEEAPDLWNGDSLPEFTPDTPQKAIQDRLHKEGFSEAEFFAALKTLGAKTTARTIRGLSDQFASGILNEWEDLLSALNSKLEA